MRGEDAVLVGRTRPAEQLQGTKVGRDKGQPGHPRGHLAASQEEVFASVGEALQIKADPQHESKIESDNAEIHCGEMYESCRRSPRHHGGHIFSLGCP